MSETYPEAFIIRNPKARKSHRCCECRGMINRGEVYERASGIWDGEPMRFKTCCDCAVLRSQFNAELSFDDQALFETLGECCHSAGKPLRDKFDAIRKKRLTPAKPVLPPQAG